jgi:hypothetical protein
MGKSDKKDGKEFTDAQKKVKKNLQGRVHFDKDTYGAVHYAVLRLAHADAEFEFDDDDEPFDQHCVLCHTCSVHVFAMLLQIAAAFILLAFANGDSEDTFQQLNWPSFYTNGPGRPAGFKTQNTTNENIRVATSMLQAAEIAGTPFNASQKFFGEILKICDKDANVPVIKEVFVTMLGLEFFHAICASIFGIVVYLMYVPDDLDDDDYYDKDFVIHDPKDKLDKKQVITYASSKAKALVICFDFLPKLALNIFTFIVGAGFVCLATNVRKVVSKSLGVTLIGKLSLVVGTVLIQEDVAKLVKKTSIAYAKPKFCKVEEGKCPNLSHFFLWPLVKLALAFGFSLFFVHWVYGDIHNLQKACFWYGNRFIEPACTWPCGFYGFYNGPASYARGGVKMPPNITLFQAPAQYAHLIKG